MDLIRHLECFVAVAEESHFGRAASRLGMAQPPLSQRIQRLERELGVRLFERTSRHVTITEGGTLLLSEARDLLARAEVLHDTARRLRDGESGLLRAGMPPDIPGETVAAILAAFRAEHADVELELHELSTAQQLEQLATHDLDVGLIHHPCDVTGLDLGQVLRREVGVLLAATSPAASLDEVPLDMLSGHELILFPRDLAPALHDDVLSICARNGFTPRAVRHGQGASFVQGLLLSTRAVAFAPRDAPVPSRIAAQAGQSDVVWRPLVGAPLAWRHSVAWPQGRRSAAVHAFDEAATGALSAMAAVSPDMPPRTVRLRPTAEYWV